MPVWIWPAGVALLVWVLVALTIYQSVHQLGAPTLRLEKFPRPDHPAEWARAEEVAPWAARRGLEFVGAFRLLMQPAPVIFAWQAKETAEYFCQYQVGGQIQYDVVSIFGPDLGLTTSSSKDAFTLPQPSGVCVQAFHKADLDTLWSRHEDSRSAFVARFGAPRHLPGPFESMLLGALRKQAAYVQRIPMWPLRGAWWYFVTREAKKNRPASELYDLDALMERFLGRGAHAGTERVESAGMPGARGA